MLVLSKFLFGSVGRLLMVHRTNSCEVSCCTRPCPMRGQAESLIMKVVLSVLLIAAALMFSASPEANAASAKAQSGKHKPLRGVIYGGRRVGGYSYKYLDSVDTRRFVDSSQTMQTPGGPFDSGFFFATPVPVYGGQAPYMH